MVGVCLRHVFWEGYAQTLVAGALNCKFWPCSHLQLSRFTQFLDSVQGQGMPLPLLQPLLIAFNCLLSATILSQPTPYPLVGH